MKDEDEWNRCKEHCIPPPELAFTAAERKIRASIASTKVRSVFQVIFNLKLDISFRILYLHRSTMASSRGKVRSPLQYPSTHSHPRLDPRRPPSDSQEHGTPSPPRTAPLDNSPPESHGSCRGNTSHSMILLVRPCPLPHPPLLLFRY
jgi:hypothetical protein